MALDFIQSQRFVYPDLADRIGTLEDLFTRKCVPHLAAAFVTLCVYFSVCILLRLLRTSCADYGFN